MTVSVPRRTPHRPTAIFKDHHTRLKPDQFIYRNSETTETVVLLAAFIGHADMSRLLRWQRQLPVSLVITNKRITS